MASVSLLGVAFFAIAETNKVTSKRKVALKNPTSKNAMVRQKPVKKYYKQSLSTRYAANTTSTSSTGGAISTTAIPTKPAAPAGPNFLKMTLELGYTSNAHDIGGPQTTTGAYIDMFVDLNLSSQFAFLIETGGTKGLDGQTGAPGVHDSAMKNTLVGARVVTYKDEIWNTYLRGYYIMPTSENARENQTMTSGYQIDATIQPTLYKGDVLSISYRFRPTFAHFYFDEIINRGNNLPNLSNQYSLKNKLAFAFWGKLEAAIIYNYTTFENTLGTRVDDRFDFAQSIEFAATDNFYVGVGYSNSGYFYNNAGSREGVVLYSKKQSEYAGYIGITF